MPAEDKKPSMQLTPTGARSSGKPANRAAQSPTRQLVPSSRMQRTTPSSAQSSARSVSQRAVNSANPSKRELPRLNSSSTNQTTDSGRRLRNADRLAADGKKEAGVSDWRSDDAVQVWYKNVQLRNSNAKAKAIRQASMDANWILQRRAKQMKEIRERAKAEQAELDAAARLAMANGASLLGGGSAAAPKQMSTPTTKSAGGTQANKSNESEEPKPQLTTNYFIPPTLAWQAPPVLPDRSKNHTKDVAIWVGPGLFVQKTVAVKHSDGIIPIKHEQAKHPTQKLAYG